MQARQTHFFMQESDQSDLRPEGRPFSMRLLSKQHTRARDGDRSPFRSEKSVSLGSIDRIVETQFFNAAERSWRAPPFPGKKQTMTIIKPCSYWIALDYFQQLEKEIIPFANL